MGAYAGMVTIGKASLSHRRSYKAFDRGGYSTKIGVKVSEQKGGLG